MQDRGVVGEQLAKAGIYLVFSLSLFAFLMFVHGARQFGLVGAAVESSVLAGDVAREPVPVELESAGSPVPEGVTAAADVQAGQDGASLAPRMDGAGSAEKFKHQSEIEALPELEAEAIVPNVYGKEAELSALQSELNRLTAMGFSFSGDLSANYVGEFYATAYCAEAYPHICGGNGVTASGTVPTPGLTVASDWNVLPPGTWVYIGGVGVRRVEDSGSAIKGARLDVVLATHSEALSWGGQGNHDVWILS